MLNRNWSRRELLGAAGALAAAPLKRLEAAVKPVKITSVDLYPIRIPVSDAQKEAGYDHQFNVCEIGTDAGVTGYSFAGPGVAELPKLRRILSGKDLFGIDRHLREGLLYYGGAEHAVWDAIGRIAGQPVYRLLGGARDRVNAYLTCVWKGNLDQSHVPYADQAAMAVKIKQAGFHAMKIRAWRPKPLDDVTACEEIRRAVGPDFRIMFDRTAHAPESAGQKVWDYATGRAVAAGLQKAGAYWLEEPFARDDYSSPAKLAAEFDMLITGGEGYVGTEPFRQCLLHRTYDILQPEGAGSGGIFNCRKVGVMAEAFNVPCILHGTMSLRLAGWLQATLAIGAEWQEVALISPPLLPEEQWSPGLKVLKTPKMFEIQGGQILAPESPGIGLDVNPEALKQYRVTA